MATTQVQYRRGTAVQLTSFTPAAGEAVVDTTNNRIVVGDGAAAGGWPAAKLADLNTNAGRLIWSSSAQVTFVPFNGDNIRISGVGYKIPSGGVIGASTNATVNGSTGQTVSASKLYYLYAYSTSGSLAIDFSTTTHATDATAGNVGTEIKTGDNSRTLVGMVYTSTASAFIDSTSAARTVLSWFNRQNKDMQVATGGLTSTAATAVPISTTSVLFMLNWANEAVHVISRNIVLSGSTALTGALSAFGIDIDSSTGFLFSQAFYGCSPYYFPISCEGVVTPSEGFHTFYSILNSGTSTSATAVSGSIAGITRG